MKPHVSCGAMIIGALLTTGAHAASFDLRDSLRVRFGGLAVEFGELEVHVGSPAEMELCSFTLPPVTGRVISVPSSSSKVIVPSVALTSFIGT